MTISPALFPAVTVTVVRDRKIRTALRTNQIAGFVTVPSWKKINSVMQRMLMHACKEEEYSEEEQYIGKTRLITDILRWVVN